MSINQDFLSTRQALAQWPRSWSFPVLFSMRNVQERRCSVEVCYKDSCCFRANPSSSSFPFQNMLRTLIWPELALSAAQPNTGGSIEMKSVKCTYDFVYQFFWDSVFWIDTDLVSPLILKQFSSKTSIRTLNRFSTAVRKSGGGFDNVDLSNLKYFSSLENYWLEDFCFSLRSQMNRKKQG